MACLVASCVMVVSLSRQIAAVVLEKPGSMLANLGQLSRPTVLLGRGCRQEGRGRGSKWGYHSLTCSLRQEPLLCRSPPAHCVYAMEHIKDPVPLIKKE